MSIDEAFGLVISGLRRQRGLTYPDIATLTGIRHNGLWKIEKGRASTRVVTLYKLAEALQVAPDELLRRTSIVYRDQRGE